MSATVLWLLAAAGLLVAEVLTLTLVLGALAAAALVAAGLAALDVAVAGQVGGFAVAAAGFSAAAVPVLKRRRTQPQSLTGVAALVGRTALVTAEVTAEGGRVTLGGESWAARPLDATRTLAGGQSVTVASVDGATLVVYDPESL